MKTFFSSLIILLSVSAFAQTNIKTSKGITTEYLKGEYSSLLYDAVLGDELASMLQSQINTDSLHNYLVCLEKYENRNSGSDTISTTRGIGAARTWLYNKFEEFNQQNGNNSVVDYLEFDQHICGMGHHKNVILVHPGLNPDEGIVIVEAHMDSRCAENCDIDCLANGIEDNGSGVALILELARVMTKVSFNKTIVFMMTTAEEQGLHGADAMALFCQQENIDVKAVFNNDVIGGILCGETASPPGCPGPGHVDSMQVRIFSQGSAVSPHKNMVRYTKMQYKERIKPIAEVPMLISIMSAEDRTGRGGDHIPFRERGYTAIRFTSANENGDASLGPDYHDHQHTSDDILGKDTNSDGVIDSFFVDFNYLKRNSVINGIGFGMVAISPAMPEIEIQQISDRVKVTVTSSVDYASVKVGVRTDSNDFDSIYVFNATEEIFVPAPDPNGFFFVSASIVDAKGNESCFAEEQLLLINSTEQVVTELAIPKVQLLQNRPNPFDEATTISWMVNEQIEYKIARIIIRNSEGIMIRQEEVVLELGINEWVFTHGWGTEGIMYYSLQVDNDLIETKAMIFAY